MRRFKLGGQKWVGQLIHGFPIIGALSQDSTYPTNEKVSPPSMGAGELFHSMSQRFCERSKGRDSPLSGELWDEAPQQQKEGWLHEPILVSDDGHALSPQGEALNLAFRFAAPQGDKNRACGDLRHSLTNRAAAVLAPIRLVSWDHVAEISNLFRQFGAVSEFFKCDHKSDYKALPVDPRETKFAVITLKCPVDGEFYAFISRTLLFGSIASVLRYNVFARIVTELFTLIFGIPIVAFFGDCGAQTPPPPSSRRR